MSHPTVSAPTGHPVHRLSVDDLAELRTFTDKEGRTWKAKLRQLWLENGDVDNPALRRVRNIIGPSGLDKVAAR